MEARRPENFKMSQMKDALRERNLSASGSKAELIHRLSKADPNVWTKMCEQITQSKAIAVDEEDPEEAAEEPELNLLVNATNAPPTLRESATMPTKGLEEDAVRELTLLRREKDLWERERRLFQRELEIARAPFTASMMSISAIAMSGSIGTVKDLLPTFDATDGTFWRWKCQLALLRGTYQLDDNSTSILISAKLGGKALSWFHSRPEYLTLNIEALQKEMEMFDQKQSKLSLRKEFEARVWKRNEPFSNYFHEKLILANRIPVAEDELLDYVIEGITDVQLQNQARIMNFRSKTDLLKAFEKITIVESRGYDCEKSRDQTRPPFAEKTKTTVPTRSERHREQPKVRDRVRTAIRQKQSVSRRSCFSCNSTEHFIKDCPDRKTFTVMETPKESTEIAFTEDWRKPSAFLNPYTVTMKIADSGNDDNVNNCTSNVIIDSG